MSTFDVDKVRQQFPSLPVHGDGAPPVYLDNPAGTQIPRTVIEAVGRAMQIASSNLGGACDNSRRADEIWRDSHAAMADLLGASSLREIVIGQSMTALTLHLSRSIGRTLRHGDEIIVTRMDHEGNVAPWLMLAQDLGLEIKWLAFNRDSWRVEREDLESLLSEKTRLLALNYASNLTGSINQVAPLAKAAKDSGALVYVDAVQLAPHRLVSVNELHCDFLVCSAYKFYGPHLGILWGRKSVLSDMEAYKCRCASNALPQRYESGTPQTELLSGLAATVEFFRQTGETHGYAGSRREQIAGAYTVFGQHENTLMLKLMDGLLAIPGLKIQGLTDPGRIDDRVPTVSFTHARHTPAEIVKTLAAHNICAWSGHNYALEVVRHLGLDERQGVTRLGIAQYNTAAEIEKTVEVITGMLG